MYSTYTYGYDEQTLIELKLLPASIHSIIQIVLIAILKYIAISGEDYWQFITCVIRIMHWTAFLPCYMKSDSSM